MENFEFYSPTKIFFGKGREKEVAQIVKSYGFGKVAIVYGGKTVMKNGLLNLVKAEFLKNGISFVEYDGITPNPELRFVKEGIEVCRNFQPDVLLGLGGGSVIDVCKAISVGYYYDGDPFDFNLGLQNPAKALPIGTIITIAAAGSELSNSCVITNPETKIKKGFNKDIVRPLFAIEDPELTYSVPAYQTAAGVVDMMMHSMERFFGPSDGNQLSDEWALDLCKNVMNSAKIAISNPYNYDARAQLMIASSFAHNGITGFGKKSMFVVHPLEHAVSGYAPQVTHGAGIGVCYLGWARYVYQQDKAKFAKLARTLFNVNMEDDEEASIMGVIRMEEFYKSIGMPTTLRELGLNENDLPELVALASGNGTRAIGLYPQSLEAKDIEAIYRLCL